MISLGQAPQGVAYVPNAVQGDGMQNLQPLGAAAKSVQLTLAGQDAKPVTQVTLFDQGIVQILQAAVTGLPPKQPYVLALSDDPKGTGHLEAPARFMSNLAGAAIVNTVGPIRQITQGDGTTPKRYLVIARGTPAQIGEPVQMQCSRKSRADELPAGNQSQDRQGVTLGLALSPALLARAGAQRVSFRTITRPIIIQGPTLGGDA